MNNHNIYINSLPSKDNNIKGKKYNNFFLSYLNNKSQSKAKLFINKNSRHQNPYFKDYLYELNAKEIFEGLASKGIFVRKFSNQFIDNSLRISARTPDQTRKLLQELDLLI